METSDVAEGKVSVILSFRNESSVIPELIERLSAVFIKEKTNYELIFVNDDSTDSSLEILVDQAKRDSHIKIINMSRRFGVIECIMAGMNNAAGNAVIYMDTDLQDPPEIIPEMLAKWRDGADVVITVRRSRQGETRFRMFMTSLAYRMISFLSEIPVEDNSGDFRLLSRRAVNELLRIKETTTYLRGLTAWIGFVQARVEYDRAPRGDGVTKFPGTFSMGALRQFLHGIVTLSMAPLYLIIVIGLASSLLAISGMIYSAISSSSPEWLGWGSFIFFLWGGLMSAIGVIAIYVSSILKNVRSRPFYIIKDMIGFD